MSSTKRSDNKHATAIESKLKHLFLNCNSTSSSSGNDFDFPKPLRETFLYFQFLFSNSEKLLNLSVHFRGTPSSKSKNDPYSLNQ